VNIRKNFIGLTLAVGLMSAPAILYAEAKTEHQLVGKFAPLFVRADPESWINSTPLTWGELNGKVVVLEVWSVASWPSQHTLPWVKDILGRYKARGLEVVGVHSPEFPHEKDLNALKIKVNEFQLLFPIMLDQENAYRQSLGITSEPATLLVDKRGNVRAVVEEEVQLGGVIAKALENQIEELLAELK
jgi:hypothetical protein